MLPSHAESPALLLPDSAASTSDILFMRFNDLQIEIHWAPHHGTVVLTGL
jgi:hypothetical protein